MTGRSDMSAAGAPATVETLAREQAWLRFLQEARFSLEVWLLDEQVRAACESPMVWLNRCARELQELGCR